MTERKRGKPEEHPCDKCGTPTSLKGWVFEVPRGEPFDFERLAPRDQWWCERHFIESMFGLWPFSCTERCRERQSELLGLEIEAEDAWVWMHLAMVLVVDEERARAETHLDTPPGEPMRPRDPKCPWCGEAMRLVEPKRKRAP